MLDILPADNFHPWRQVRCALRAPRLQEERRPQGAYQDCNNDTVPIQNCILGKYGSDFCPHLVRIDVEKGIECKLEYILEGMDRRETDGT